MVSGRVGGGERLAVPLAQLDLDRDCDHGLDLRWKWRLHQVNPAAATACAFDPFPFRPFNLAGSVWATRVDPGRRSPAGLSGLGHAPALGPQLARLANRVAAC